MNKNNPLSCFYDILEPPENVSVDLFLEKCFEHIYKDTKPRKLIKHRNIYVTYIEAQKIVKSLNIKGQKDYQLKYRNNNLPSNPAIYYYNDWEGWYKPLSKKYLSFSEARKIARSLHCPTYWEYKQLCKRGERPVGLHARPHTYYVEWQGWPNYLGYIKKYTKVLNKR